MDPAGNMNWKLLKVCGASVTTWRPRLSSAPFLAEIRISMGLHHGICDVLEAENTVAYRGLGIGHYNMGWKLRRLWSIGEVEDWETCRGKCNAGTGLFSALCKGRSAVDEVGEGEGQGELGELGELEQPAVGAVIFYCSFEIRPMCRESHRLSRPALFGKRRHQRQRRGRDPDQLHQGSSDARQHFRFQFLSTDR